MGNSYQRTITRRNKKFSSNIIKYDFKNKTILNTTNNQKLQNYENNHCKSNHRKSV